MNNGNENIVHVETIENLIKEIKSEIESIWAVGAKQTSVKEEALEYINDFEEGPLPSMRTLFEGD